MSTTSPDLHSGEKRLIVLVAVIGVVATLLGAAVGGFFSYLATTASTSAQQEQSLEQFQRDQRKETYASIATAARAIQDDFVYLTSDLSTPDGSPSDSFGSDYSDFYRHYQELRSSVATSLLVGADIVNSAATDFQYHIEDCMKRIAIIQGMIDAGTAAGGSFDEFKSQFMTCKEPTSSLLDTYMQAARSDLGYDE